MTLYTTPHFTVDSHGAYVTKLVDTAGKPILFERTMLGDKRRGGAHVCLPYFGPDAAGALPQHGFGRDVEWKTEVTGDDEISCTYMETTGDEIDLITGLTTTMTYSYDAEDAMFYTTMTVCNPVKRNGPQPFSPGFHPYFAVDPNDVRLNGEPINLADFEPFKEFPNTPEMTIESRGRAITVSSQDLQHMVVWTDLRGDYLCVEPTLMGNAFDSSSSSSPTLQSQDIVTYQYKIAWSDLK